MYVGQQPSTTFDSGIQDRFTGLTTNTVTLTHDISAETDILVVWNNIVQDSSTYSVGGTGNKTLTLGGSLVSADIVTVYYTNRVMQSVNPTANSVGITELNVSDGSNGQALTTNGSGTLSFASAGTTINNNADNRVITGSGTANTLEGEQNLTFDGATGELALTASGSASGTQTLKVATTGNANPAYTNLVFKSGGNTSGVWIKGVQASGGNDGRLEFHTNNSGTVGEAMRIMYNGTVLINTTSTLGHTQGILHVKGKANNNIARFGTGTNGEGIVFVNQDNGQVGNITVNASSTSFGTSSDYRLKENVNYNFDATTRLKQLKPARFNFIADKTDTLVDGFIAHEVTSVVPESINGTKDATETYKDENGDDQTRIIPQGIDQSKLVPLLTKALQEAITKIETLEARVKTLEDA